MAMSLSEIVDVFNAEVFTPDIDLSREISLACASDLMSDVLSYSMAESVLLTGLISPQTVRTAEIAELTGICFVFGKKPPKDTVALANELGIPLIGTRLSLYGASGILYSHGISGCYESTNE